GEARVRGRRRDHVPGRPRQAAGDPRRERPHPHVHRGRDGAAAVAQGARRRRSRERLGPRHRRRRPPSERARGQARRSEPEALTAEEAMTTTTWRRLESPKFRIPLEMREVTSPGSDPRVWEVQELRAGCVFKATLAGRTLASRGGRAGKALSEVEVERA